MVGSGERVGDCVVSGLGVGVVSKLRAVWCDGWSGLWSGVMGEKRSRIVWGLGKENCLG